MPRKEVEKGIDPAITGTDQVLARPDQAAERAARLALGEEIYNEIASSLNDLKPLIVERAAQEGYLTNLSALVHLNDNDEHMAFVEYLETILPPGFTALLESGSNSETNGTKKMTVKIEAGDSNSKIVDVEKLTMRIRGGGFVADLVVWSEGGRKLVISHAPSISQKNPETN